MDAGSTILSCLLMFQMTTVLVLLNPINDVRKMSRCINKIAKYNKNYNYFAIALYYGAIAYLGMYIPLQEIHSLITNNTLTATEKLIAFHRIEKNYFIAGFSLFLFIVQHGIKAIVTYAATLLQVTISTRQSIAAIGCHTTQKHKNLQQTYSPMHILPNLLRAKRSISYETIMFANEVRDQLRAVLNNSFNRNNTRTEIISHILETNVSNLSST
ncbi:uncharacterized protein LOC123874331 [Maniola jurtina]|uniref:uncharacterized protein LOC123874331 n=1 Tax=Maniola jurtina TaxID=191418 RepID=UPI001E68BDB8|nr:uncharacterized protein LOC123874331 [Maniola jurtina]